MAFQLLPEKSPWNAPGALVCLPRGGVAPLFANIQGTDIGGATGEKKPELQPTEGGLPGGDVEDVPITEEGPSEKLLTASKFGKIWEKGGMEPTLINELS